MVQGLCPHMVLRFRKKGFKERMAPHRSHLAAVSAVSTYIRSDFDPNHYASIHILECLSVER